MKNLPKPQTKIWSGVRSWIAEPRPAINANALAHRPLSNDQKGETQTKQQMNVRENFPQEGENTIHEWMIEILLNG